MFKLFKMMFQVTPRWIKSVEASGTPARAIVISLPQEVAVLKGGKAGYEGRDGWVKIPVEVLLDGDEAFTASMTCKLSQAIFGLIEPESTVNVRFDPENRDYVLLVDDVNTLLQYRVVK